MNNMVYTRARARGVPKPRREPPAGRFIYNGAAGWDFVQARRWLWQYQPPRKLWVVIDG